MARILIIDDDEMFCSLLSDAIQSEGRHIECAGTLQSGLARLRSAAFDIVFLDVNLPDGNGLERLADIRESPSAPEVIILTGRGTSDGAELAIKNGVWDYIQKPSSIHVMTLPLLRALQFREEKSKSRSTAGLKLEGIVGDSAKMKACYELVLQAAMTDVNVLITGETGTGKELFARAVHVNSARMGRNFVVVDCAALQDTLKESTLFGHEKGAFTGADQSREGLIKQADGGTLFLDEIGELPVPMQKSFLRVLQERHFRPLGSTKELKSDFRLIAATNRDLEKLSQSGGFREDLLFRLRTLTIDLPPLREHPEDIDDIASYHIARICKRSGIAEKALSSDFLEALIAYDWPGNARELVHALERAVAASFTAPTLFRRHLPSSILVKLAKDALAAAPSDDDRSPVSFDRNLPRLKDLREMTYAKVEQSYLRQLLKVSAGDMEAACRIADVGRTRLYDLLRKHQIPVLR